MPVYFLFTSFSVSLCRCLNFMNIKQNCLEPSTTKIMKYWHKEMLKSIKNGTLIRIANVEFSFRKYYQKNTFF